MTAKSSRYREALKRNLSELQRAILNWRTLSGIKESKATNLFLKLTEFALFNDYIAHCIKVFEDNKDCSSFWYIYRCQTKLINAHFKKKNLDIEQLKKVGAKLKIIRDKTHFHIDKKAVSNPQAVWRAAGLYPEELEKSVKIIWDILYELQDSELSQRVVLPYKYDSAFIKKLSSNIEELTEVESENWLFKG